MGQALEEWVLEHMYGVLIGVEIMWVGGVLAVFVVGTSNNPKNGDWNLL